MKVFLLGLLLCAPACGWWCEGHQVVALIAERHLEPRAKEAVLRLLKTQPAGENSEKDFCSEHPDDLMAAASIWADVVKKSEQTGTWHYMDIPLGLKKGSAETYCEPVGPTHNGRDRTGCLLTALRYNLNILHDDKESDFERARALRYLIHLVGDLHQPLHTTANNDAGGNCTPVQFFDEAKISNLHSVWDGQVVNREIRTNGKTVAQIADELDEQFKSKGPGWTKHGVEFEPWIWEGHRIAQQVVYGDLTPHVTAEPFEAHPNCKVETEKNSVLHLRIGPEYDAKAAPVIQEQLAKAGYRLAEVLNEVWP